MLALKFFSCLVKRDVAGRRAGRRVWRPVGRPVGRPGTSRDVSGGEQALVIQDFIQANPYHQTKKENPLYIRVFCLLLLIYTKMA